MVQKIQQKVVGRRTDEKTATPQAYHQRHLKLQRQADRLNPYSRPRRLVFKAPTYKDYEAWRAKQENPRLW